MFVAIDRSVRGPLGAADFMNPSGSLGRQTGVGVAKALLVEPKYLGISVSRFSGEKDAR
jgi:hypothetical protein